MDQPADGDGGRADGTMPQPFVQFDTNKPDRTAAIWCRGRRRVDGELGDRGLLRRADLVSTGVKLQVFDQPSGGGAADDGGALTITPSQQDFAAKNLTYQGWRGQRLGISPVSSDGRHRFGGADPPLGRLGGLRGKGRGLGCRACKHPISHHRFIHLNCPGVFGAGRHL